MNELINESVLRSLSAQLRAASPESDLEHLATIDSAALEPLSLRERSDLVGAALLLDLPGSYAELAAIFRRALADPRFRGWSMWPVTETVTTRALDDAGPAAFDDALELLAELTPRLTAEFAIRRLLEADVHRAIAIIQSWTGHPDEHVRRLASEGTRPFLPWAIRVRSIIAEPSITVPVLDGLYRDGSEYVRRSVANHLNDLSRNHPELVVATAARWLADADGNTLSLVRRALRTLIKRGDPGALALLGYSPVEVIVTRPTFDVDVVTAPGSLQFEFDVTNTGAEPARVAVDYAINFMKSNGRQSEKVFKLATRTLLPNETAIFSKSHAFRQMTTRVHYAGTHSVEVQVNGRRYGVREFQLEL